MGCVKPMATFNELKLIFTIITYINVHLGDKDSFATVGEIRVYWRANFQSGSRVLKKVF